MWHHSKQDNSVTSLTVNPTTVWHSKPDNKVISRAVNQTTVWHIMNSIWTHFSWSWFVRCAYHVVFTCHSLVHVSFIVCLKFTKMRSLVLVEKVDHKVFNLQFIKTSQNNSNSVPYVVINYNLSEFLHYYFGFSLRHHSLNQHLRLICKRVPGSAEDSKETKVTASFLHIMRLFFFLLFIAA